MRELRTGHCTLHASQQCPWKHDDSSSKYSHTLPENQHAIFEDAKLILQLFADAISDNEMWSQGEPSDFVSPVFESQGSANVLVGASIEKNIIVTCLWDTQSDVDNKEWLRDFQAKVHTRIAQVLQKLPFLFCELSKDDTPSISISKLIIEYIQNQHDQTLSIHNAICWQINAMVMSEAVLSPRMQIDLLGSMHLLSALRAAPVTALGFDASVLFATLHPQLCSSLKPFDLALDEGLVAQRKAMAMHVSYWEVRMRRVASMLCLAESNVIDINQFIAIVESIGCDLETVYAPVLHKIRGTREPTNDDLFDTRGSHRRDTATDYMVERLFPLGAAFASHIFQLCVEHIGRKSELLKMEPPYECWRNFCVEQRLPTCARANDFSDALNSLFSALHRCGVNTKAAREALLLSFEQRHHQWLDDQLKGDTLGSSTARSMRGSALIKRSTNSIERRMFDRDVTIRDYLPAGVTCIRPTTTLVLLRQMQYAQKRPHQALKHCVGMKRVSDAMRSISAIQDRSSNAVGRGTGTESQREHGLEVYFDMDESIGAEACAIASRLGHEKVLHVFWNALRKRGCISAAKYCLATSSTATGTDIVNAVLNIPTSNTSSAPPRRVGLNSQTVKVMLLGMHGGVDKQNISATVSRVILRQILEAIGRNPELLDADVSFLLFRCLGASDATLGAKLLMNQWDSPNSARPSTNHTLSRSGKTAATHGLDAIKLSLRRASGDESVASETDDASEAEAAERAVHFTSIMRSLGKYLHSNQVAASNRTLLAGSCGFIAGLTTLECRKWIAALGHDSPSRFFSNLLEEQASTSEAPSNSPHCVATALLKHVSIDDLRSLVDRQLTAMESGKLTPNSIRSETLLSPTAVLLEFVSQVSTSTRFADVLRALR